MEMSCRFMVVLYLTWLVLCGLSDGNFVAPIKNFLDFLDVPLKMTLFVCWSFVEKSRFLKEFQLSPTKDLRKYQIAINGDSNFTLPIVEDESPHLIILDMNCTTRNDFLPMLGSEMHKFKWLFIAPDDATVKSYFGDLPLHLNSEVYCVMEISGDVHIKEVYKINANSEIIIETVAIYRDNAGMSFRDRRSMVQRRKNLRHTTLRASLVITNNDTLYHLVDYRDRHIDTISKVCFLLTNYLMEYLNASVNYSIVSQWGYLDNQTGRWSGMIGDLVENRAEIGATALFFTSDRIEYIDFIAMPAPTLSKFVFRSPKLSYTDDVFILPFDKFVWYCLVAVFFISALALVGTVLIEWRLLSTRKDATDASVLKPSFHDTLVLVLAAACQQGSAVSPKSFTARIVMIVTYITLMFLYTSYSANIVALLQSPSTKIKTLEDLLSSRLKFGVDDTVFNRYYFSHATEPTRRKIYEQKILQKNGSSNFMPLADGVERIRRGLFAFHMELGVGYKIMSQTYLEHEKCSLQEIQYLQVIDPWYAIRKNSSYKEVLKTGMMRLHEYGLQDRENKRLYTKKPVCSSGGGKFTTASLVDIQSALILLSYGFLLSIILLAIEKVTYSSLGIINMEKGQRPSHFPFQK